jgi:hypothetical protein
MYNTALRNELTSLADVYAKKKYGKAYLNLSPSSKDAIIFNDLVFNFHPSSWNEIDNNTFYKKRTIKIHSHFKSIKPAVYEMQSSNSSDALAMNVFCYPNIQNCLGLKSLFEVDEITKIDFGFKAKVLKIKDGIDKPDKTEVDLFLNDNIICECKLTEEGFTIKNKAEVESYKNFSAVFHTDMLIQNETSYLNYQLIRNILAAYQHKSRFILLCDMRRPDLAKSFYQTVRCIQDRFLDLRTNCEIVYWQDIAQLVPKDLKHFLKEKYGIS